MITLAEVDKHNWEECTELRVSKEQEQFVAPNWYSILQSNYEKELYPLCIYNRNNMVGFLMYGIDPDTNRVELSRLMIDFEYQGRGYGEAALLKLLKLVREKYGEIKFHTSITPENIATKCLYEKLGFEKTGEVMWGEEVMTIQL